MTANPITLHDFLMEHTYSYESYREMYPESMPDRAHRYTCSEDFIRDARRYGHFFDESTMRTFKTKVADLIGERFLILSDKFDNEARHYRVAYIYQHDSNCNNPDHIRKSVERLETKFSSLAQARKAARTLTELLG